MDKEYGFYDVVYEDFAPITAITIGDGSVLMSGIKMDSDGFMAIAFSCGRGRGVGVSEKVPEGTKLYDIEPDFLLRFDNPVSVDVLIEKLDYIKKHMENINPQQIKTNGAE